MRWKKQDQFAAKETKKFIVTVRDVWRIPDEDIKIIKEQTEKLTDFLKDTPYGKYATAQGKTILDILTGITKLQAELEILACP